MAYLTSDRTKELNSSLLVWCNDWNCIDCFNIAIWNSARSLLFTKDAIADTSRYFSEHQPKSHTQKGSCERIESYRCAGCQFQVSLPIFSTVNFILKMYHLQINAFITLAPFWVRNTFLMLLLSLKVADSHDFDSLIKASSCGFTWVPHIIHFAERLSLVSSNQTFSCFENISIFIQWDKKTASLVQQEYLCSFWLFLLW